MSQSVAGEAPGTFQIVNLIKSLGDLDTIKSLQQARGDTYKDYQKAVEDMVDRVDIVIGRFVPDLSNPPDEVVAADPDFWRPKPARPRNRRRQRSSSRLTTDVAVSNDNKTWQLRRA